MIIIEGKDLKDINEIIMDACLSLDQECNLGIDVIDGKIREQWERQLKENIIENIKKKFGG